MLNPEPLWYKDAVIYELHVRAFFDSSDDGMGDFDGLTQKLDYLQDLGITAIWLLPFYPSPLRDDGYDIADYTNIHEHYGTLDSFRRFLDAAHERGLRVITELVINHTSDQHPWFQRARRAPPGSVERDFYVWNDTPEKYHGVRIIFQDFEASNWTYDHIAKAYYWHRFYSHQPDLNFDNPAVGEAILPVLDLWMEMGVDGMRLDAVPYLFEREGTICENLPETHAFLKALRRHMDQKYPGRMLLSEANQWPEDAVQYFGAGDESHMAFHFPLMPRLFMSIQREDRFPIIDIIEQTPPIPENCQWALFLRNHDELTLEMVTDEERDYMYKVYALESHARINLGIRRRLAPLLDNNRRRIELMNCMLFSMPGTPVLYYGDEIGMGDNIYLGDRNGVRTPMQWSPDRNAGFSRANAQRLYLPVIIDPEYHYESINVDAQQRNASSLLWWTKRLIDTRKRYKAFSRGSVQFLHPHNRRVLAFLREYENERLLIVANLSRYSQYVELDLSSFQGIEPVELFGMTRFPAIRNAPYVLTLGPHGFYWFELSGTLTAEGRATPRAAPAVPLIQAPRPWQRLFDDSRDQLTAVLPGYLNRRWSLTGDDRVKRVWLTDVIWLDASQERGLIILEYESHQGIRRSAVLPIAWRSQKDAQAALDKHADRVITRLADLDAVLIDPSTEPAFCDALLQGFEQSTRLKSRSGATIQFRILSDWKTLRGSADEPLHLRPTRTEQFNTSVAFGSRFILKLYRHAEEGRHPEVEVGRYLSGTGGNVIVPPLAGVLELRKSKGSETVLGILHGYVPTETDGWQLALDQLSNFGVRLLTNATNPPLDFPRLGRLAAGMQAATTISEPPEFEFLPEAILLGRRTAEMHVALAKSHVAGLGAEPLLSHTRRSMYQSMRNSFAEALSALRFRLSELNEKAAPHATNLLNRSQELMGWFRRVLDVRGAAVRIHTHGYLHLDQVLYTGKDFMIIDFEGNPQLPLSERWIKRSPLQDVASMLCSFDAAARATMLGLESGRGRPPGTIRPEDAARLAPWFRAWVGWTRAAFVRSYLTTCRELHFAPLEDGVDTLLAAFVLEKGVLDLLHELLRRPQWVEARLTSLLDALNDLSELQRATPPTQ